MRACGAPGTTRSSGDPEGSQSKMGSAFVELPSQQGGKQPKHDGCQSLLWPPGLGTAFLEHGTPSISPTPTENARPQPPVAALACKAPRRGGCPNTSSTGARVGSDGGSPEAVTSRTQGILTRSAGVGACSWLRGPRAWLLPESQKPLK